MPLNFLINRLLSFQQYIQAFFFSFFSSEYRENKKEERKNMPWDTKSVYIRSTPDLYVRRLSRHVDELGWLGGRGDDDRRRGFGWSTARCEVGAIKVKGCKDSKRHGFDSRVARSRSCSPLRAVVTPILTTKKVSYSCLLPFDPHLNSSFWYGETRSRLVSLRPIHGVPGIWLNSIKIKIDRA